MNSKQFTAWHGSSSRKPLVMGVLNITPDSFSDAGRYFNPDAACRRAETMIEQGVDIIDIGGESSRPGALPISLDEELARTIPIIERIHANHDVCISIDTYKPQVMAEAVRAGASIINDIYALEGIDSLSMAAKLNVPVCLMHMQGTPATMQINPSYVKDIVTDINVLMLVSGQVYHESG